MQPYYIYLLLIDLVSLVTNDSYKTYEEREPGYSEAMLKAYVYAFGTSKDTGLNEDLITNIHKIAMGFGKNTDSGKYKTVDGGFNFALDTVYNTSKESIKCFNYNASEKGLKELVDYWFIKHPQRPLILGFLPSSASMDGYYIHGDTFIKTSGAEKVQLTLHFETQFEIIKPIFSVACNDVFLESLSFIEPNHRDYQSTIQNLVNAICKEYNEAIKKAVTDSDKITVIVTYIQRIEQLHPFLDGNLRTCYILLNKLLRDNNLSLTVLMNPNRFDCCSREELVEMVIRGQNNFKKIISSREKHIVLENRNEKHEECKSIFCLKMPLIAVSQEVQEAFIKSINANTQTANASSASLSTNSMFKNQPKTKSLQLISELNALNCTLPEKLLNALTEGKPSLALRIACSSASCEIIGKILDFSDSLSIDFNEKSSNGNRPLEWLRVNPTIKSDDFQTIAARIRLYANPNSQKKAT